MCANMRPKGKSKWKKKKEKTKNKLGIYAEGKTIRTMARVVLAPFIESISGKVGELEFRTLKSGKTVVHTRNGWSKDKPKRKCSEAELAQQRRFSIVSRITAKLQSEYARIDKAAADRHKIWNQVSRHYERILKENPQMSDSELETAVMASVREKRKGQGC